MRALLCAGLLLLLPLGLTAQLASIGPTVGTDPVGADDNRDLNLGLRVDVTPPIIPINLRADLTRSLSSDGSSALDVTAAVTVVPVPLVLRGYVLAGQRWDLETSRTAQTLGVGAQVGRLPGAPYIELGIRTEKPENERQTGVVLRSGLRLFTF